MQRKLAAIFAADVVGFARLMGKDEAGTLERLTSLRTELVQPQIAAHKGRTVKLMGDGLLAEFPSVVEAVQCAVDIQTAMAGRETGLPEGDRIRLRIGINLGDIIVQGTDIYGDGVNVAARMETLANPGGVCVSGTVHDHVKGKLDLGFVDLGDHQVKSIQRPIHVYQIDLGNRVEAPVPATPLVTQANKPSIAVLPFHNMSGDPDQIYFSDGITDDIITDLSRYNELFVIARHTTFEYRDNDPDKRRIARTLGVRHILTGSVRRSGNRVRVSAQLIDTEAGTHIWAERFDRDLEDIFAVQDEITAVIVNALAGELTRRHYTRTLSKGPDATDAYDHALRAMHLLWKVDPQSFRSALDEAERAVAIDPQFARAHALVAWSHVTEGSNFWGDNPARSFQRAYDAALAAVAADDREPWAHAAMGWAHIWGTRAHAQGVASLRRALDLNPSNAHFHSMLAWGLGWSGESEEALQVIHSAMRLNPQAPVLYLIFLGRALFNLHRFGEALPPLQRLVTSMPEHSNGLILAAACYAAMDNLTEAHAMIDRLATIGGGSTLSKVKSITPYAQSAEGDFYFEMLRRAGLPD